MKSATDFNARSRPNYYSTAVNPRHWTAHARPTYAPPYAPGATNDVNLAKTEVGELSEATGVRDIKGMGGQGQGEENSERRAREGDTNESWHTSSVIAVTVA